MKAINIRLDNQLDHRIRVMAAHRDMTRAEFVRVMLREKLEELERDMPVLFSADYPQDGSNGNEE